MTTRGDSAVSRVGEEPPALQRHVQGFEIAGRHVELVGRHDRLARRRRVAFGDDDTAAAVPAEGQEAGRAGGLDARQRADPLERTAGVRRAAPRRRDSGTSSGLTRPVSDVFGDEAGVDAQQALEAGQQQPAADEQHEGERDLRHDQAAPDVARASAGRAGPAVLAQDVAQIHSRQLHGRRDANDDAEQRGQAERERSAPCRPSGSRARAAGPRGPATRARRGSRSQAAGPGRRR